MNNLDELRGFINEAINLKQKLDNPARFNKDKDKPPSHSPSPNYSLLTNISPEFLNEYKYAQSLRNEVFEWKGTTKGFLHESKLESTAFLIERLYTELPMTVRTDLKAERTFIEQAISTLLNLCEHLELFEIKQDIVSIDHTKVRVRNNRKPKPQKIFPDFIKVEQDDKRMKFAEFLKKEFQGKKGKTIAFMICVLRGRNLDNHCKVIEFTDRKALYNSIREFFGSDIGSDAGINKFIDIDKGIPRYKQEFNEIQYKINCYLTKENIN